MFIGLAIGSPEAKTTTVYWTGMIYGRVCDRIGRTSTLLLLTIELLGFNILRL
jgi:hypothetical protein